jgi:hypothetical protein
LKVEGLGDKLKHDNTYYFTVTVVNSAGLTSIDSCNITVEILPPDVSNVTLSYMFSDDEEIEEASLTSEDRDIGMVERTTLHFMVRRHTCTGNYILQFLQINSF